MFPIGGQEAAILQPWTIIFAIKDKCYDEKTETIEYLNANIRCVIVEIQLGLAI